MGKYSNEDIFKTAYHEAGHAVVGNRLGRQLSEFILTKNVADNVWEGSNRFSNLYTLSKPTDFHDGVLIWLAGPLMEMLYIRNSADEFVWNVAPAEKQDHLLRPWDDRYSKLVVFQTTAGKQDELTIPGSTFSNDWQMAQEECMNREVCFRKMLTEAIELVHEDTIWPTVQQVVNKVVEEAKSGDEYRANVLSLNEMIRISLGV